jgi:hypothetical protein
MTDTILSMDLNHHDLGRTVRAGIDSDLLSIVTATSSVTSNQPGAGLTMQRWLSRGGQWVDRVLCAAAAAKRARVGPDALVLRVLCPPRQVVLRACRDPAHARLVRDAVRALTTSRLACRDVDEFLDQLSCATCRE